MTSVALGLFIVFIIYVIIWSIKNDDVRSIGEQTGFIKMRDLSKKAARTGKPGHLAPQAANDAAPPQDPRNPPPPEPLERVKTKRAKNR